MAPSTEFTNVILFHLVLHRQRGLCYTFNSGQPGHPLVNATALGISQALSLILDVQPEEYYGPFSYDATGIKLVLHEQYEWPQVENLGIDLTPGYNTNIRIKRNKVSGHWIDYIWELVWYEELYRSTEVDTILRVLQISSFYTIAEFNNCFIIIQSKYFQGLSVQIRVYPNVTDEV